MSPRKFDSWLFGRWGQLRGPAAAWLKDVIWPERAFCCACGRATGGEALCAECLRSLRDDGALFAWERDDPEPGLPAWSLRLHEGVPRELVIRLKYSAEARAARLLAELVLPLPPTGSFPPDTVVTWVTMPESRKRERAVDHGRLLAEAVAEKLSLPCRQLLLRRDGREKRQVTLNAKEREANLQGAFRPMEPISFPVLLVDDVRTTGTTLIRCAEALRAGGAQEVSALTFTRRAR